MIVTTIQSDWTISPHCSAYHLCYCLQSVAAKLLSLWLLQVQMAGTAAVVESRARFLTSLQIDITD